MDYSLNLGTAGWGVWHSPDAGKSYDHRGDRDRGPLKRWRADVAESAPARPPNATMWGLATHPADASRIVAWTLFGEVYVSEDVGESWRKISREFGEIRAAAWLPN